jgi:predicted Zn finger-like uncharacterized protein
VAVLNITCPSCGAAIKIPDPEPHRMVIRCPKCKKGFPLSMAGEEGGKDQASSEERERAPAKRRFRPGIVWGLARARIILPVAAFV